MAGVAAASSGRTKDAANLAAELVRMGWGVMVSHISSRMSHAFVEVCWACMSYGLHDLHDLASCQTCLLRPNMQKEHGNKRGNDCGFG